MKRPIFALAAALLTLPAFSQADECAFATDLGTGNVIVPFDTNACVDTMAPATQSAEQQCFSLSEDVWFKWTATSSGSALISTCDTATFDTELAIWQGSDCSNLTPLGCNDDTATCSNRTSEISISVTAGETYFVQLGYFSANGGTWGFGTLRITDGPVKSGPTITFVDTIPGTFVDISTTGTALMLEDDGEVTIPASPASSPLFTGGPLVVGSNGGISLGGMLADLQLGDDPLVLPNADVFAGQPALLPFWDDVNTDSGVAGEIYHQVIGGTLIIQWENVSFFDFSGMGPGTFTTVETATFQVQIFPGPGPLVAQFLYEDIEQSRPDGGGNALIGAQGDGVIFESAVFSSRVPSAVSNGDVLSLLMMEGLGVPYCQANPNSTGAPGELSATGSPIASDNNVTLNATQLPLLASGFFLTSATQGLVMNPGGSAGNLCLGGSIGRYVGPGQIQNTGTSGSMDLQLDLTMTPQPTGFVPITSGQSWNFQAWFRDSSPTGPTSNFTGGLEITFL